MGKKNSIFSAIKKWLTGKPKNDKIKEANRVTNYGGGYKSNNVGKKTANEIRSGIKTAQNKQSSQGTQNAQSSSAFKAAPPSVRKAEAKDKQTSKKSSSYDPFNKKDAFKVKHQSTALGTMSSRDTSSRIA